MVGPRVATALRALLVAVARADRGLAVKHELYSEKHAHFCDCDECLNPEAKKHDQSDARVFEIETRFHETKWVVNQ